jgi:hypothetical protein
LTETYTPQLIRINVSLTKSNKEFHTHCDVRVSENIKIDDLIKIAVDKFNEDFRDQPGSDLIQFRRNFSNYELRPSKKNGLPKLDLPSISSEVKVTDTYITQFSLLYKEEDVIRQKMKSSREASAGVCKRCVIF